MEEWEDNEERIERYLEGKMGSEEEELFMQDLNANKELRKQYEDELLISALVNDETAETDETKATGANSKINNHVATKKVKTILHFSSPGKNSAAIAALAIIIVATVVFIAVKTNHSVQPTTSNGKQPSVASADTANNPIAPDTPAAPYASALYEKFYTPYVAKNDPVEISAYYNDYKQKNYKKVLAASEQDYQVMGAEANHQTINNYMHFYKGLCYLEKDEPGNAAKQFDSLLRTGNNMSPINKANWYKALVYLKLNQTDSAMNLLSALIQNHSSYKKEAEQLLTELKQTK